MTALAEVPVTYDAGEWPCECRTGSLTDHNAHDRGCFYGARLPVPGERAIFGRHRLPKAERETMDNGRTSR